MPEVMSIEVDEEFDPRPPSSPFGLRDPEGKLNWGMIAGIAIAIILVIALILVVAKPFEKAKPPVVSTWTPKDPTKDINFLESYPDTSPMVASLQNSLEAWAKYYTTADLKDLISTFDLAGNQYALLVEQQPAIAANPEPGEPAIIEIGPVGKVSRKNDVFTVRAVINWTKPGSPEGKVYKWDIDMKSKENIFILNTVRDTDPTQKQPVDFCGAVNIVAGLDSDDEIAKNLGDFDPAKQVELLNQAYDLKVKAWEFLEIAVAGTDSALDVDPIISNYRDIQAAGQKAKSIKEIGEADNGDTLTQNRQNIEERASQECDGADISKR